MGDFRQRIEVRDVELRVADGFSVESPRPGRERLTKCLRILRVHELHRPAQLGQGVVKELIGPAIEVVRRHDFVADLSDGQQSQRGSALAGRNGQSARAAFQRCDALLEDVGRRVHDPRIDVAEFLKSEKIRRVICALKNVGGGLVDGHRPSSGRRIRSLPGVEGQSAEVFAWYAHIAVIYCFSFGCVLVFGWGRWVGFRTRTWS